MQKRFFFIAVVILTICFVFYLDSVFSSEKKVEKKEVITKSEVKAAEPIIGLTFTDDQIKLMLEDLRDNLKKYEDIRKINIENGMLPAVQFNPVPVGFKFEKTQREIEWSPAREVKMPDNREDLAFYSVRDLAELIRTRQITSTELTQLYLQRLKKYDGKLKAVITLTEDLALKQAKRADEEIAAGKYRGLLHGIPYGVKDLLSVKGYKTTWGAMPYKDQIIDKNATVVKMLEDSGAVLVAKLTLGALAWGDVWYAGKTRNPWNLEQGSSGSSAGPASATSAGLIAFAIGSETWGSIVSPSTRCGATGLRPTYGRVSRVGAMALSWSMDKLGPICRTVEDCAIVFNAIYGPDDLDPTLYDLPFNYSHKIEPNKITMGYFKTAFEDKYPNKSFDKDTLAKLGELGFNLVPIELPDYPVSALSFVLNAEAAAAFDDLMRSKGVDKMVRQDKNSWPNVFRYARFIPAVEYIQANRLRNMIIQEMNKIMSEVDLYVAPSFGGDNLLLTNLTGHPCVVLPNGFNKKGSPVSISFIGQLFDEGKLLAVAKKYQDSTDFHLKHPDLSKATE